jgi:glycosyltransferase involved in cell wall biosynthesis
VVVTSYNQEQWIEQALDSVSAQTEQRLQLIVTDDGSQDGSCERISQWIERYDPGAVLVASEHNVGLPAVLNLALPLFEGEYVVVLNGDDWMDPDRIERQAEFLDRAGDDVSLAYCDLRVVDAEGTATGEMFPPPDVERREGNVLHHLIAHPMIGMPSVMVRREVFDVIGPWDEALVADDFDFLLRVAAAGFEFGYLAEQLVNYRQYGTSLTGGRSAELIESRFLALRKLVGTSDEADRLILRRMEGLVVALHGVGYERRRTRAHIRFVLRRAPSRRLARIWVESRLGLRPGYLGSRRARG